jgi:hypothetical protein
MAAPQLHPHCGLNVGKVQRAGDARWVEPDAPRIRWLVATLQQQFPQQLGADGVLRVIGCR